MIFMGIALGVLFLSYLFPAFDDAIVQKISELLIALDGTLFGFTAVMTGLFLRERKMLASKTMSGFLTWALLAFWSFIFSILFCFILIGLGQESTTIPAMAPVLLTVFGGICASVYMVLVLADEYFPPQ